MASVWRRCNGRERVAVFAVTGCCCACVRCVYLLVVLLDVVCCRLEVTRQVSVALDEFESDVRRFSVLSPARRYGRWLAQFREDAVVGGRSRVRWLDAVRALLLCVVFLLICNLCVCIGCSITESCTRGL